jgi:hypothetical protein
VVRPTPSGEVGGQKGPGTSHILRMSDVQQEEAPGVRGQVLMSLLVRVHMSVAGQAGSLQGTTSIRGLEPILEPVAGPVDGDDVAVV